LHRRGEDSRLEGTWNAPEREKDLLSDEEIAEQWEYKVADPHTPRVEEIAAEIADDAEELGDNYDDNAVKE
jgi:GTP-binding protein